MQTRPLSSDPAIWNRLVRDQVIDPGSANDDAALDAIGAVIGKSHNEIRRYLDRAAKAQGSAFMSEHVPAGE